MSSMYGFVNTDSWGTNVRPQSWRDGLLKWFPNGKASLTALTSKMLKTRKIIDPVHHWWVKDFPLQRGALTTPAAATLGLFTDSNLTVAYVSGATIGTTLHLGVAPALAAEVRTGHKIRLTDASHPRNTGVLLVTSVTAGFSATVGRISCTAIEADDGGSVYAPAVDWSNCDYVNVIGNLNAESANRPSAIQYDADSFENYTNIWRTALNLSRTAERTKIRYASDAYKMLKADTLELHAWEMEKDAFTGVPWVASSNGNPIRSCQGLLHWIEAQVSRTNGPSHVYDFVYDTTVPPGTTWDAGGEKWVNESLAGVFANGDPSRFCFCGTGAAMGLTHLAEVFGNINLTPTSSMFGLDITEWKTSGINLAFKTHPLFNANPLDPLYNAMVIFNPANVGFCYIDDTTFRSSPTTKQSTDLGVDGRLEEFLTEGTFEWGVPCECAILYNVGKNKP